MAVLEFQKVGRGSAAVATGLRAVGVFESSGYQAKLARLLIKG
jgi:hypothetical protein